MIRNIITGHPLTKDMAIELERVIIQPEITNSKN